jgi:hypothetical protein
MPNPPTEHLFGRLEEIQHSYFTLLQAELPAALDRVEAFWLEKGDPLELPDVAQWYRGNITAGYLYTVIQKLPAVTVEATRIGPTGADETGVGLVDLIVSAYTLGQTPEQADRLIHRYAAAVAAVIVDHRPAGIKSVGKVSVVVGEAVDTRHRQNYLKDAQVSMTLRVGAFLG